MRRTEKKHEADKNANYKNLIAQYYDRDSHLSDVKQQIKTITPTIDLLDQLNQFERKIDGLIKTKRYDVQELYMKPPQKLKRLLRVKVTREEGQGQQLLKIFGCLYPKTEEGANLKFTSFFRQATIINEKDKAILQSWKKPTPNFPERDGLIIRLPSNIEEGLSVHLTLITNPPKFQVDPMLQKIVGLRTATRIEVLDAFWLYVKTRKLQDVQNKEIINSDELIRQAFKAEKLTFATINHRVRQLLISVQPVRIPLGPNETQKVFDVIVQVEEKPNVDIVPFFSQKLNEEKNDHPFLSLVGRIKKYDNKCKEHAQKLRRHLAKRELYSNFSAERIEEIICEQQRLLVELKKADPLDDYSRLEYVLQSEQQLQREIKHYFEHLNANASN